MSKQYFSFIIKNKVFVFIFSYILCLQDTSKEDLRTVQQILSLLLFYHKFKDG